MATLNTVDNNVYRVQKKVIKHHLTVRPHVKEVIRLNLNMLQRNEAQNAHP